MGKNGNNVRIGLCVIMKDESHIVTELLNSVHKYIDYWIFSDTGSSDNSVQIVEDFFREKGIPGEMHHDKWVNFGHNRSKLLKYSWGHTQFDYAFVLDCDDVVTGNLVFPSKMNEPSYSIQLGQFNTFKREQIFSTKYNWEYRGIIHEFPVLPGKKHNRQSTLIPGNYYIEARCMGDRSKDPQKFLKDAKLCEKGITEDPEYADRYTFYAAQCYFDYGDFETAIKYYKMRIEIGGWIEEVYTSYSRLAQCYDKLGYSKDRVKKAYMTAFKAHPARAEPLYELAKICNAEGNFQMAYNYAVKASKIPYPGYHALFSIKAVYDFMIPGEIVSASANMGNYREAMDVACRTLRNTRHLMNESAVTFFERYKAECVGKLLSAPNKGIDAPEKAISEITTHLKSPFVKTRVSFVVDATDNQDKIQETVNSFMTCCEDFREIGRYYVIGEIPTTGVPAFFKSIANLDAVDTAFMIYVPAGWIFYEKRPYVGDCTSIIKEASQGECAQILFNRYYTTSITDFTSKSSWVETKSAANGGYYTAEYIEPDTDEYAKFVEKQAPNTVYVSVNSPPRVANFPSYGRSRLMRESFANPGVTVKIACLNSIACEPVGIDINDFTNPPYRECIVTTLDGYYFMQGRDSHGGDLGYYPSKTLGELKEMADASPEILCFNSLGYVKNKMAPLDKFINLSGKGAGLYIKKHVMNNLMASISTENITGVGAAGAPQEAEPTAAAAATANSAQQVLANPVTKGEFDYYPEYDFGDYDYKHMPELTEQELLEEAENDPMCMAFNSRGWFKYFVSPDISTWTRRQGSDINFYVRKSAMNTIMESQRVSGEAHAVVDTYTVAFWHNDPKNFTTLNYLAVKSAVALNAGCKVVVYSAQSSDFIDGVDQGLKEMGVKFETVSGFSEYLEEVVQQKVCVGLETNCVLHKSLAEIMGNRIGVSPGLLPVICNGTGQGGYLADLAQLYKQEEEREIKVGGIKIDAELRKKLARKHFNSVRNIGSDMFAPNVSHFEGPADNVEERLSKYAGTLAVTFSDAAQFELLSSTEVFMKLFGQLLF